MNSAGRGTKVIDPGTGEREETWSTEPGNQGIMGDTHLQLQVKEDQ